MEQIVTNVTPRSDLSLGNGNVLLLHVLFKQPLAKKGRMTVSTIHHWTTRCLLSPNADASVTFYFKSCFIFISPCVFCLQKQKTTSDSLRWTKSWRKHIRALHASGQISQQTGLLLIKICALADRTALYKWLEKREETQSTQTEAKKPHRSTISLRR